MDGLTIYMDLEKYVLSILINGKLHFTVTKANDVLELESSQ